MLYVLIWWDLLCILINSYPTCFFFFFFFFEKCVAPFRVFSLVLLMKCHATPFVTRWCTVSATDLKERFFPHTFLELFFNVMELFHVVKLFPCYETFSIIRNLYPSTRSPDSIFCLNHTAISKIDDQKNLYVKFKMSNMIINYLWMNALLLKINDTFFSPKYF